MKYFLNRRQCRPYGLAGGWAGCGKRRRYAAALINALPGCGYHLPVCKHNMTECAGRERQRAGTPDTETPPEDEGESSPISAIAIVLLILAIGGVAVWYFVPQTKDSSKGKNLSRLRFRRTRTDYERDARRAGGRKRSVRTNELFWPYERMMVQSPVCGGRLNFRPAQGGKIDGCTHRGRLLCYHLFPRP